MKLLALAAAQPAATLPLFPSSPGPRSHLLCCTLPPRWRRHWAEASRLTRVRCARPWKRRSAAPTPPAPGTGRAPATPARPPSFSSCASSGRRCGRAQARRPPSSRCWRSSRRWSRRRRAGPRSRRRCSSSRLRSRSALSPPPPRPSRRPISCSSPPPAPGSSPSSRSSPARGSCSTSSPRPGRHCSPSYSCPYPSRAMTRPRSTIISMPRSARRSC